MICEACSKEMSLQQETCTGNAYVEYADGVLLPTRPYDINTWMEGRERCPDCGVLPGGKHHPCCDQEQCPRCGAQLISCRCKPRYSVPAN